MRRWLRIRPDLEDLSHAVAAAMLEVVTAAAADHGHCSIALAGGATPRQLYQLLATRYSKEMPWRHLRFFFGDERYVPADDPRSNYRMFKEALLDRLHLAPTLVYPMPTVDTDYREAALMYEATLREHFEGYLPRFDLVLLGLGEDGHTASLFPGSAVLDETVRWVAPSLAPEEPQRRMTLTYPVINHAANVFFLVSGQRKAGALRRALQDGADPMEAPAAAVRPTNGELVWWVDEAAATHVRFPPKE